MSYTIIVICTVCKKVIGTKPGGIEPDSISHSYCGDCATITKKETENLIKGGNYNESI